MTINNITLFDSTDYLQGLLLMSTDEIWNLGINLDDWDYGICLEGQLKTLSSYLASTDLPRLLNGSCDNEWYEVKSNNGKWYTIGIAYHA